MNSNQTDGMITITIPHQVKVPANSMAILEFYVMGGRVPFPPKVYTDLLSQVDDKLQSDYVMDYVKDVLNYGVRPGYPFMSLYSAKLEIFNGKSKLVPAGTTVIVKTVDGVRCGLRKTEADGFLRFLPVYANDPYRPGKEGPNPGDELHIFLATEGGQGETRYYTNEKIVWTNFGDRVEIGRLYTTEPINKGVVVTGEFVGAER